MSDDTYFELPAHEAFGPQGVHVAALIERARHLTPDEASALDAARDDALDDTWGAAWRATWGGAWGTALTAAAWDAAWDGTSAAVLTTERGDALAAALDTVCALVVRDLITTEGYDTLTRTWRTVIGPIHPDDPDLPAGR